MKSELYWLLAISRSYTQDYYDSGTISPTIPGINFSFQLVQCPTMYLKKSYGFAKRRNTEVFEVKLFM
nr:hypothetical protein [uncultured Draconibacterium sp.]